MWKFATPLFIATATSLFAAQTASPKETEPLPPPLQASSMHNYMMISPSQRALDFQQAFEQLRKEKTAGKVYFQLSDGTSLANIIDMTLMSNSTLILFRFNSSQGVRFQVVKIEDIVNLLY